MLRHVLEAGRQPGLAGKGWLGTGRIKKSGPGWPGRRLGLTGLCSIIPAWVLLAGGSHRPGSVRRGGSTPCTEHSQRDICKHQGKWPPLPVTPRVLRELRRAWKGGCVTRRHTAVAFGH